MATASASTLVREKLDQAVEILREQDVDLWLTLARETLLTADPCLDLIAGTYCAWQGAFLVSASGERIAVVGRFDAPNVEQLNAYVGSHRLRREHSPSPARCDRATRPAIDRAQLLRERSRCRRPHTWALARAQRGAHGNRLRRPPRLVGVDRQRAPRAKVARRRSNASGTRCAIPKRSSPPRAPRSDPE